MIATIIPDVRNHYPVLLSEIISIITPQHGGTFIDCTFGGGGYSNAILDFPNTKVLGIDRDKSAQKRANVLVKKYPDRFNFILSKFSKLKSIIKPDLNPKAIIFDLGLSSFQLSDHKRGFSFKSKESLSMEMGLNTFSAYDVVNTLDKESLTNIIKILGDEKDGKKIANNIIKYREKKLIQTGEELSLIINNVKKKYKKNKINPATKTFQGIRIFVNEELTELILGLISATELLKNGGVLIILSFHSLEDRIVKFFFSLYSNLKKNPSRYLPMNEKNTILFKLKSKKSASPDEKEILNNPRSRSAKLRYAVRNENPFLFPNEFRKKFDNYFKLKEAIL